MDSETIKAISYLAGDIVGTLFVVAIFVMVIKSGFFNTIKKGETEAQKRTEALNRIGAALEKIANAISDTKQKGQ